MRIRSFFAASVEAALEEARREFGPEAMLIQSRPAPPDARGLGAYEVVCALLPADAPAVESPRAARENLREPVPKPSGIEQLTDEVAALRGVVERLDRHLVRSGPGLHGPDLGTDFEPLLTTLLDAEVDAELARELILQAASGFPSPFGSSPASPVSPRERVRRQLASAVGVLPFCETGKKTVAAFAGPPGAGKTACIAKIAARFGVAAGRSTEILVCCEHRVAACEPLQTYAAVLGAAFRVIDAAEDLPGALEQASSKDLLLIDTPGFAPAERSGCQDLARTLREQSSVETHLVLPCSIRSSDLRRISEFYEPFNASALIFTRLDETRAYGAVINEAVRTRRPISFLSAGPRIPGDLEAADSARLADLVLMDYAAPRQASAARA